MALSEAKKNNCDINDEIRFKVRKKYKIPFELDFTVLLEK